MQICMKATSREKGVFLRESRRRLNERGWSLMHLARITGVHQSQLSRILSGDFTSFSSSVMQICNALNLGARPSGADRDREAIVDSALAIWDGSTKDREDVVRLLNQIAKMRRSARANRRG
jgi:transcriptional regulator with XRE-family HTH domain